MIVKELLERTRDQLRAVPTDPAAPEATPALPLRPLEIAGVRLVDVRGVFFAVLQDVLREALVKRHDEKPSAAPRDVITLLDCRPEPFWICVVRIRIFNGNCADLADDRIRPAHIRKMPPGVPDRPRRPHAANGRQRLAAVDIRIVLVERNPVLPDLRIVQRSKGKHLRCRNVLMDEILEIKIVAGDVKAQRGNALEMRSFRFRNHLRARNLIHISDDDDVFRLRLLQPAHDGIPLPILAHPARLLLRVVRRRFGKVIDDDMDDLILERGKPLLILIEIERFRLSRMRPRPLNDNKPVNDILQDIEPDFTQIQLVIDDKAIVDHGLILSALNFVRICLQHS